MIELTEEELLSELKKEVSELRTQITETKLISDLCLLWEQINQHPYFLENVLGSGFSFPSSLSGIECFGIDINTDVLSIAHTTILGTSKTKIINFKRKHIYDFNLFVQHVYDLKISMDLKIKNMTMALISDLNKEKQLLQEKLEKLEKIK